MSSPIRNVPILLPLYIFCGEPLLRARLRVSNIDGAAGSKEELQRIVGQIRQAWPGVRVLVRGDSGFCREELMAWCEEAGVDYVLGLAKNDRLRAEIALELQEVAEEYQGTGKAVRRFKEFEYQTRESWSRARRVVGKAEHLEKGPSPRFVVTSLKSDGVNPKSETLVNPGCMQRMEENECRRRSEGGGTVRSISGKW
ncbi:MAG: transposase [Terriglobia bacterium]